MQKNTIARKIADRLPNDFDERNPATNYWSDGESLRFRCERLKGADPLTFRSGAFFGWDERHVWYGEGRIKADAPTFRILNYTFAADKNRIFTPSGKAAEADAATFEALDDGKALYRRTADGAVEYNPYGYARDKDRVYYHDFQGKLKVVKDADTDSFVSLNDGFFAKDAKSVFSAGKRLLGADITSWRKIAEREDSYYSKDDKRIFYLWREIKGADYGSFEIVICDRAGYALEQLAKDKNAYYKNDETISEERFRQRCALK